MKPTAAFFDAFGTVVRIGEKTNPYRQLLREGIKQRRRPHAGDVHLIMTLNLELHENAEYLGIQLSASRRARIESALRTELESNEVFPDATSAIATLQQHRVTVGISSNLAKPYGAAVKKLFPQLDAYAFSYEVGAAKPDPRIYLALIGMIDLRYGQSGELAAPQTLMVGDLPRCDPDGAKQLVSRVSSRPHGFLSPPEPRAIRKTRA